MTLQPWQQSILKSLRRPKPPWINHIQSNLRAVYVTELPAIGRSDTSYIRIGDNRHFGWVNNDWYEQHRDWLQADYEVAFFINYDALKAWFSDPFFGVDLALGHDISVPVIFK